MDPLASFNGTAPLFPLPGATLFPHVVQPFHMFEPRYRELADAVMDGDRLMAVGILKPNTPELYNTKQAPIFDTVCLGNVTDGERLADGRFNLIVSGLKRARVIREPATSDQFRTVELELIDDQVPKISDSDAENLSAELVSGFGAVYPQLAKHPAIRETLENVLPLGILCDFLVHIGDADSEFGARVLGEVDVLKRTALIRGWLDAQRVPETTKPFPPEFSDN